MLYLCLPFNIGFIIVIENLGVLEFIIYLSLLFIQKCNIILTLKKYLDFNRYRRVDDM